MICSPTRSDDSLQCRSLWDWQLSLPFEVIARCTGIRVTYWSHRPLLAQLAVITADAARRAGRFRRSAARHLSFSRHLYTPEICSVSFLGLLVKRARSAQRRCRAAPALIVAAAPPGIGSHRAGAAIRRDSQSRASITPGDRRSPHGTEAASRSRSTHRRNNNSRVVTRCVIARSDSTTECRVVRPAGNRSRQCRSVSNY